MKKTDQLAPLAPRESKKIACADAVGVQAPVRFDSPAQIRTLPRTQAVSFRKPPDDPKHLFIVLTYPQDQRASALSAQAGDSRNIRFVYEPSGGQERSPSP